MAEDIRKLVLYFRNIDAYWQLSDQTALTVVDSRPFGRYPLNIIPRLTSGHFNEFDLTGLPLRRGVHNYTTIAAYALGSWDNYLLTGDKAFRANLVLAADYIVRTAQRDAGGALRLRTEIVGQGHCGALSGMPQGEAVSVLCRAWHATAEARFLEAAIACLPAFDQFVGNDGLLGYIGPERIPWYEEATEQPLNHILNGMIYALWGFRDLVLATNNNDARRLLDVGVASVAKALPLYDAGYWSWYFVAETRRHYIASMMYHTLHIRQLTALGEQFGNQEFLAYAKRFDAYARDPMCRARAAALMLGAKFALATGKKLGR